jgi:hypothetical protein
MAGPATNAMAVPTIPARTRAVATTSVQRMSHNLGEGDIGTSGMAKRYRPGLHGRHCYSFPRHCHLFPRHCHLFPETLPLVPDWHRVFTVAGLP